MNRSADTHSLPVGYLLGVLTGGLLGLLYDLWTLNAQVSEINGRSQPF